MRIRTAHFPAVKSRPLEKFNLDHLPSLHRAHVQQQHGEQQQRETSPPVGDSGISTSSGTMGR